jgi:alpha-beta hydrolase superfamily lysophospholipase
MGPKFLIPMIGWTLAMQALAFRFGYWGLHTFPRWTPPWLWFLPAAAALFLLIWPFLDGGLGRGFCLVLASCLPGLLLAPIVACLVRRHPEMWWIYRRGDAKDGRAAESEGAVRRAPTPTIHAESVEGMGDGCALLLAPAKASPGGADPEGKGGALVVIAHGGGNDRLFGLWYMADCLIKRGHTVLTAHLPGHGKGGGDTFSLEACRSRLDALLAEARRCAAGRRVLLFGQSLGGSLALDLLARTGGGGKGGEERGGGKGGGIGEADPLDGVITVSAPSRLLLTPKVFSEMTALFRPAAYRALRYGNPYEALPAFGWFKRWAFPVRVEGDGPYLEHFAHALAEMDLSDRLRRMDGLPCPVLLIQGTRDGVVPVEQARDLAEAAGHGRKAAGNGGELRLYPGVTHLDPLFTRNVVRDIVEWVSRDEGK